MSVSESSITNSSEVETLAIQPHKLLILDARSYAAAVANRAKGGGCECPGMSSQLNSWLRAELGQCVPWIQGAQLTANAIVLRAKIKTSTSFCFVIFVCFFYHCVPPVPEYYPNCEVVFMGMANIHSIRKSFQSLRFLCTQMPDPAK